MMSLRPTIDPSAPPTLGVSFESTPPKRRALMAGGMSGGHVFPALAVAEELALRGWWVGFVGTATGIEARLAQERGVPFFAISALPLVGRGIAARLRALAVLLSSSLSARGLVRRLGAAVVLGTGSFVSAPTVLGARLAGRPVLLVEPNAAVGFANRWLSRVSQGAAIAFESAARQLKCPTWRTGVPVRRAFFEQQASRNELAIPTLLVLGGSQGSAVLNRSVPRALAELPEQPVRVVHQTGRERVAEAEQAYRDAFGGPLEELSSRGVDLELVPFVDDPALAMAESDLILSRAGAITVAEICAVGRASILVPLTLAGGHQRDNALALVESGAALIVDEANLEAASLDGRGDRAEVAEDGLSSALGRLLGSHARRSEMALAAHRLSRADAAPQIADRLESLVAGRSGS